MSDDQNRPLDPDAPAAPAAAAPPAYAMPAPPPGHPAYAAPERPRFADQVLGMRAVVAVAVACLLIGGLSGYILGHAAGSEDEGYMRGPMMYQQRGGLPDGWSGFPSSPDGFPRQQATPSPNAR